MRTRETVRPTKVRFGQMNGRRDGGDYPLGRQDGRQVKLLGHRLHGRRHDLTTQPGDGDVRPRGRQRQPKASAPRPPAAARWPVEERAEGTARKAAAAAAATPNAERLQYTWQPTSIRATQSSNRDWTG